MCAEGDNFIKDSDIDMTKNKLVNNLGVFSRVRHGSFQVALVALCRTTSWIGVAWTRFGCLLTVCL